MSHEGGTCRTLVYDGAIACLVRSNQSRRFAVLPGVRAEFIEVSPETDIKNKHACGFKGPTRAARSFQKNGDLNFSFQSDECFQD